MVKSESTVVLFAVWRDTDSVSDVLYEGFRHRNINVCRFLLDKHTRACSHRSTAKKQSKYSKTALCNKDVLAYSYAWCLCVCVCVCCWGLVG